MTKRSRILAGVIAGAVLVVSGTLFACAPSATASPDDEIYTKVVPLPDGRSVVCVVLDPVSYENGALSCDWATAK